MSQEMTDQEWKYLWERRDSILYHARLSAVYHRERERFISRLSKLVTSIALIGGSAAFVSVASPNIVQAAGLVIVLATIISLVFDFQGAARLHAELASRFERLIAEIKRRGERDFSEDDLNSWDAEIHEIQSTEPPPYLVLVKLCQNRLNAADGHPDKRAEIGKIQRLTANIIPWSSCAK